MQEYLGEQHN